MANSRRKGHDWEREVARAFRQVFGDDVHRGWQARRGSDSPDVVGVPGFWVECKRGKRTNIRAALAQAMAEAGGRAVPIAVCKDDRQEPTVTLRLVDFLDLCRRLAI